MSRKVLIVEDSRATRELLVAALEERGDVELVAAASGFDALRELARDDFALIVTDVNMPDLNGLELLRFVRQSPRHRDVPLIVVSSESKPADRARGLSLGASEWLGKPFDPAELVAVARRWLDPA